MKSSERVILTLIGTLSIGAGLFLSGFLMPFFYWSFGETTYAIRFSVRLLPVLNINGGLIDVEVAFDSRLDRVRVPQEVTWPWWQVCDESFGVPLFGEAEGSFSLSMSIKVENFSDVLFWKTIVLDTPVEHTVYSIYFERSSAKDNSVLQLSVSATKTLSLLILKDVVKQELSYLEKFQI